ncbi:MAG: metallophosphoesterase [Candidatus Woesebacteria bacterium]|jgi:hypothetical protein
MPNLNVKKITTEIKNNFLFYSAAFLLIFIPLYPKIPLFSPITGYLVRVRLEDILVFITAIAWFIQLIRKKIVCKSSLSYFILAYIFIGLLSILSGMILIKTIPLQLIHIAKSSLHWLRYIEYFFLFFLMFTAIKSKKQLRFITIILSLTIILTAVYGFGQKYLHWPLYSTMNREYSKGQKLYLNEHARVQSTFGGHYDLAAFLVITLPIVLVLAIKTKTYKLKIFYFLTHLIGLWLLLAGASKTSFASYGLSLALILFYLLKEKISLKKIVLAGSLTALTFTLIGISLIYSNQKLKNKTLLYSQKIPVVSDLAFIKALDKKTDQSKPIDVYVDTPDYVRVATVSATGEQTYIVIEKQRTWSENAIKYGLSMGIRLDTLWPMAVSSFRRHIFLGSAYGNLNKQELAQFTESDSTDNNYLRTLGETGLFGFITFYLAVLLIINIARKNIPSKNQLNKAINLGFFASSLGLLLNAVYIDVFAASKVAFTFWALAGIVLKSYYLQDEKKFNLETKEFEEKILNLIKRHWHFLLLVLIFSLLIYKDPFSEQNSIINLNPNAESFKYLTPAKCLREGLGFQLCREVGQLKADRFSLYSLVLTSFLFIKNDVRVFAYFNLILTLLAFYLFYKLIKRLTKSKSLQLLVLIAFLANPLFVKTYSMALPILFSFVLLLISIYGFSKKCPIKKKLLYLIPLLFLLLEIQALSKNYLQKNKWAIAGGDDYFAVKQANLFFQGRNFDQKDFLITNINPYFIDFYRNSAYQLLPLSKEQFLFNNENLEDNQQIWGQHDFNDLINLYQNILKQENNLFLSAYKINTNHPLYPDFKNITQNFNTQLNNIACDDDCLLFEIKTEPDELIKEIKSITQYPLNLETTEKPYSFLIIANEFTPDPNQKIIYDISHFSDHLTKIINQEKANFVIVTGEICNKFETADIDYLLKTLNKKTETPVFFVPGKNTAEKKKLFQEKFGSNYLSFQMESEYFILLDSDINHQADLEYLRGAYRAFKKFIIDNLIKVSKNPDIKNLFIISGRSHFLADEKFRNLANEEEITSLDQFFVKHIIPELKQLKNINIYLISQDLIQPEGHAFFYHQDDNIHYLNSSMNHLKQSTYLNFKLNENNQLSIRAMLNQQTEETELKKYNLDFWQKE